MGKLPITERVTDHTELLTLLAYPIRHSISPTMHNEALKKLGLDYVYVALEVDNSTLEDAVQGLRAWTIYYSWYFIFKTWSSRSQMRLFSNRDKITRNV